MLVKHLFFERGYIYIINFEVKHVELSGGVMSNVPQKMRQLVFQRSTFLEVFLLEPRTLIPAVFVFPYGNSH